MQRVIVGTAGHIDHGKTRLVEALTGTDCDRWAEEKRRGITIDIGFAHIVEDDLQIGFVDVPGHEKFLHNALAGLGGISVVLLVVAADEGVKPQTREHLAVCDLLAIPAAVVALTKTDLVSPERLAQTREEVTQLLAPTRFAESALLPVSAVTGDGVGELRSTLVELGRKHAQQLDERRPLRLPIDRVFLIKGRGLVVTGTLAAGRITVGDELVVDRLTDRVRVRGIQVHGEDREQAAAGERVALQLAGIEAEALARGMQLRQPGESPAGNRWAAELQLLSDAPRALRGSIAVRLHLYSAEVLGKLRPLAGPIDPGSSGPVEIKLAEEIAAVRGDRFVIRRPSPAMTIAGGRVLDPRWRRRKVAELETALTALGGDESDALALWIAEAGEGGATCSRLAVRLGWTESACLGLLEGLASEQKALRVSASGRDERWLTPSALRRIEERARRVLAEYFTANRLKESMPRAEAVASILPGRAAELATAHFQWLAQRKVLTIAGDQIRQPGRGADLTGVESKLAQQILAAYEAAGLKPPAPSEVRAALGAKARILDGIVKYLLEQKKLARLPGDLFIAVKAVENLRCDLETSSLDRLTIGDFKQRYDLSRKWAIPLLEHLDSIGATRRLDNERQIIRRQSDLPQEPEDDR